MAIRDAAALVDAKVPDRQAVVTDTVLAVRELAHLARRTTRRKEVEAATTTSRNEGSGAGSKSREEDEALHCSE